MLDPVPNPQQWIYGAILPVVLPGWDPGIPIDFGGPNWQMHFKPDGSDYLELKRGGNMVTRHLEGPNVFIGGSQGMPGPDTAVESQKPIIDTIRGLLLMSGPPGSLIFLPSVWEGACSPNPTAGRIMYRSGRIEARAPAPIPAGAIIDWKATWEKFDPSSAPDHIRLALRWYYKGVMDLYTQHGDRTDAFISLWISIISLTRPWYASWQEGEDSETESDPGERLRFHHSAKDGMGLSDSDLEQADADFKLINTRRNELFKRGGGMKVTDEEATIVTKLALGLLDHETKPTAWSPQ